MKHSTFDLTHRVDIIYNSTAGETDGNGDPVKTWAKLATVFAERRGLGGSLFYKAAAAANEDDQTFSIYWRPDIRVRMLFVEGGITAQNEPTDGAEVFEVKVPPVDPDGKRMWLEVHCRRLMSGGG